MNTHAGITKLPRRVDDALEVAFISLNHSMAQIRTTQGFRQQGVPALSLLEQSRRFNLTADRSLLRGYLLKPQSAKGIDSVENVRTVSVSHHLLTLST